MPEEKKYPEPIVGALIINEDEKILLAKSPKWKNKWVIFGGHVETGEKLEDAVQREIKEETALNVEVIASLGFSDSVFAKDFHEKKHFIFLDYLCRFSGKSEEIKVNNEYEGEYKWFDINEALKLDLGRGTKKIIEEYNEYKKREEYLNNWKRCQADFENYKKDQVKVMDEFRKFACMDMVLKILPILDNFNASLDHVPEDQKNNAWVTGITYIKKQLEDVLKNNGVEEIIVKEGDEFSPHVHEAITNKQEAITKEKKNIIKQVIQKGYKIDGKVIRPARVIVE